MKDYYYILGIKQSATEEEIKKAHRKLSLKFHPDKNEGDEFFTERFKEIQEAYETLIDNTKRVNYNKSNTESSNIRQSSNGINFTPEIEYFKTNKEYFEYDEEITFTWKTINADKVILKPFGVVSPIGQKTYKIKDLKNVSANFDLIAENTNISRQIKSSIVLKNKTYQDLHKHFKEQIESEAQLKNQNRIKTEQNTTQFQTIDNNGFSLTNKQLRVVIISVILIGFTIMAIIVATTP